jgi:isopentenyl diphosphate isomerase/L-lactate dehydrogenase-like FMN-dependent dehydrogenase
VKVEQFLEELRVAIFLAGGRSVADLHVAGRVILGETPRWIDDHGYGVDGV